MVIEIVELSIDSMVIFHSYVNDYQRESCVQLLRPTFGRIWCCAVSGTFFHTTGWFQWQFLIFGEYNHLLIALIAIASLDSVNYGPET
jgi:hypothetical protein